MIIIDLISIGETVFKLTADTLEKEIKLRKNKELEKKEASDFYYSLQSFKKDYKGYSIKIVP